MRSFIKRSFFRASTHPYIHASAFSPMTDFSEKKAFLFYFLAALFLSLPFLARPLTNPDLFWHLSAGKFILENLAVPRADFLSWTERGSEWIDFEWLTQAVYFFIHSRWDLAGLYFLKILLLSANLFAIALLARFSGLAAPHLLWLLPFSAASLLLSNDIRPENFSLLFFSLTLYLLEKEKKAADGGFSRLIRFAALYLLWANLHGGFFYGLALISLYAAGSFLNENEGFWSGKNKRLSFSLSRPFLLFLAAAFFAAFLNPYGYKIYSVILDHYRQSSLLQDYICEWQPFTLSFRNARPFAALMALGLGGLAYGFFKRREKDFTRLLTALFFSWLCLSHLRNLSYGTMVFAFLFYSSAGESFKRPVCGFFSAAAFFLLIGLHSGSSLYDAYRGFSFGKFSSSSEGLADFLKKNASELGWLKMSNPWEWGGWLGWKLHPAYGVFVDGRYIFHGYLKELADSRDYLDSWREAENRNRFEMVLMKPENGEILFKNPAKPEDEKKENSVFLPAGKWALVYFDSRIFAAVKRDSVSPGWLKENEYLYLRPWGYENLLPEENSVVDMRRAERELARYYGSRGKDFPDPQLEAVREWHKGRTELSGKKKI